MSKNVSLWGSLFSNMFVVGLGLALLLAFLIYLLGSISLVFYTLYLTVGFWLSLAVIIVFKIWNRSIPIAWSFVVVLVTGLLDVLDWHWFWALVFVLPYLGFAISLTLYIRAYEKSKKML